MSKEITLEHISKIEGHAKLHVAIKKGNVEKAQLEVFEGARFFEGILKGRSYNEVAILAARICGICSCIHITAALTAIEDALDVVVSEQTEKLRELMCLGERIRSHITHLYFLALPDYLGYESAIAMMPKYGREIKRAFGLMKLGNDLITTVAGRDLHPAASVIGGFSRTPDEKELNDLLKELKDSRRDLLKTARLFMGLKYPVFERKTHYFAIEDWKDYFTSGGRMSCFGEYCILTEDYNDHIKEYLEPYSTAKFAVIKGKSYMVGALARMNNHFHKMNPKVRELASESKMCFPTYNPFMNNPAQALELVDNVERAIRILKNLDIEDEEPVQVEVKASHGISAVEAPRGTLFHEYGLDDDGEVIKANIMTPTAQNLKNIEDDIKEFLPTILKKSRKKIVIDLEKLIRSYDPCISCSTHFLEVDWE